MISKLDISKPYNQCLHCSYQERGGERCDGPRTSSMPIGRWREFMRDLKEVKHLTYEDIAERTNDQLSAKTIQNALALSAKGDITRETARLIENAIFGSSSQYPCYLAFEKTLPAEMKRIKETEIEIAKLHENIKMIHDSYKEELSTVRSEAQSKIAFLREHVAMLVSQIEKKDKMIEKLLDMK